MDFFPSSEKLIFEKENVILFNTFLNLDLFYLIVVNFLWISFIWTFRTSGTLRLKEILYFSIIARGSLKTLACHSLPKYWMQRIGKSWNKMYDN